MTAAAAAAAGVVLGLALAQTAVAGMPRVPPVGAVDTLPWIAAAGALAGAVRGGPGARVAGGGLVLLGGIGWIAAPLAARGVVPSPALAVLAVAAGALALRERGERQPAWLLPVPLAAGLAAAAAFGAALGLALLFAGYGLVAAALAGAAHRLGRRLAAAETALLGAMAALAAILAQYATPSPWALLLLALLPAVEAGARRRGGDRQALIACTLVAGLAALVARAGGSGLLAS